MTKPSDLMVVKIPPPPRTAIFRQRIDYHISCEAFVVLESGLIKLCMQLITSVLREGLATGVGGQGLDRWSESEVAKHPPEISRRIIIHGHVTSLPGQLRQVPTPFRLSPDHHGSPPRRI